ncbi:MULTISPECIES: DHA2 family efflux MFS transporter permease subunit [unclassified Brevibacterium]|uniref:DHA2 family efflux MFS transporter permease subunit n=1 Tax=unclassified Brevibacterium TaxID=2614124 RepID=UPI001E55F1C7|nr:MULTISPECIES: DHA2 family efflux MFS transporter permease subunit [unclassified Brevibacterium]MCD1287202.1 MFS transporter [Brevibacterium sp. CCUG 69071]MDK8436543.1 DHA2 family efflux MFS transporter permease subunit [Brevibacterium sp. H-BE7]
MSHTATEPTAPSEQGATQEAEVKTSSVILLFIGLMLAMFMFSLNQTMLATALPTIVGDLNGVDQMLWVSTAFMLASTIMMPIYGKLGDSFNRKKIFIFAICMFILGSVVGFAAHSMAVLITARVIQGLGGGGLIILAQSLIAAVVPARQRGKYMGIMGANFAVTSVAGPLIGGWITEGPGWRWTFALNWPFGVLALIAAMLFLKVPKSDRSVKRHVDYAGMILIAEFTTALILTTSWGGHQYDWNDPIIIGLIGIAVLSAVVFVFVERAVPEPIIPMFVFTDRNFIMCTIAGMCIAVGMFGVLSYMPTFLQMAHGIEATKAGLLMVPMMAVMLPTSIAVGFIVSKTGRYKYYPVIGSAIVGVALFLMGTFVSADQNVLVVIGCLCVLGLGLGLSMQMLVLIVQNSFPVAMVGTATASNNFFRQIGGTLGMSLIGALFTSRLSANLEDGIKSLGPQGGAALKGAGSNSLTPEVVTSLPDPIHSIIINAYSDALVPIFLWVSPLGIIAALTLLFVREKALATKVDGPEAQPPREVVATDSIAVVEQPGSLTPAGSSSVNDEIEFETATRAAAGGNSRERAHSPKH